MTFNNEQKQAEFNAFAAYFTEVSKQPFTAARRSLVNNLRSIAVGQFGNAAWQELVRDNRSAPEQKPEIKLGKPAGDGSSRRNQSPGQPKIPPPGSDRAGRIAEREARGAQKNRSAASVVVAGGETAESLIKVSKRAAKEIAQTGATVDELAQVQLSTGAIFDTETVQTERPVFFDATYLSAKELVEKYGRDLIYDYLFNAGEEKENLDQKTDRQLANILKKKVGEA